MSEEELMQKLSQRRNIEIENYKEFKFPHAAAMDNSNQPYIFAKAESNMVTRAEEGAIHSLKGVKRIEPANNSAGINEFYVFPELPNKG